MDDQPDRIDWTTDETGASNSSPEFQRLVDEVERLIRHSGFSLVNGQTRTVAQLIMAQLAHKHHLRPAPTFEKTWRGITRRQREAIRDAVEQILEER